MSGSDPILCGECGMKYRIYRESPHAVARAEAVAPKVTVKRGKAVVPTSQLLEGAEANRVIGNALAARRRR